MNPRHGAGRPAFLNAADYIAYRLCGIAAQSRSLASRTGLIDLQAGDWSEELLDAGPHRSFLAHMIDGGEPLGPVQSCAQETGLTGTTLVAVGGHDHPCGALAAGAVRHGDFLDSMGTTECLFIALERPFYVSRWAGWATRRERTPAVRFTLTIVRFPNMRGIKENNAGPNA